MILASLLLLASPAQFQEIRRDLTTRTPVLTYHDVIEKRDSKALWFDCTVGELNEQLDWLKGKGAAFVTLDQLRAHLVKGTPLPRRAIVVTFADNYRGFYDRAWPILKRRGVPVAMFVHTGFVGNTSGRPKMSWAQLSELRRSGLVTVASQTVSHSADLRTLSYVQLDKEMSISKMSLEAQLGVAASYLAYPNGKWDQRSVQAARKAGYLMAFTEDQRPAERATSILAVPRYVHTKYRQAWREAYGK